VTRSSDRSEHAEASILAAADGLASGAISSQQLIHCALARARHPQGEGSRVYTQLFESRAPKEADAWDRLRAAGYVPTPLAGLPVSVKDLFDVAGEVTTAGSRVLADRSPAEADALVVARLRQAGAVIVGKTNMTEFAYSGLGLNPHYGTPANPYDRSHGRIPGGSSSGAAISISDGMALGAIGTDTGGSVRIPAALCGLVGFKPTAARIPLTGAVPLSRSLDSIGPIARTVECCAILDAVMAGLPVTIPEPALMAGLRIGIAQALVWDDADRHVVSSVQTALARLSAAGARLMDLPLSALEEIPRINATGGLAAAEAYAWHAELLAQRSAGYDPRVAARIEQGRRISAAEYLSILDARRDVQQLVASEIAEVDVWVMPTVPLPAPLIGELATDDAYFAANRLMLRNPSLVNFLDACAISIPCHGAGTAPAGLSLVGRRGEDRRLLAVARTVSRVIAAA